MRKCECPCGCQDTLQYLNIAHHDGTALFVCSRCWQGRHTAYELAVLAVTPPAQRR